MNQLDLTPKQQELLRTLLNQHLPGIKAWVYGSRAKGTATPASDLDLVLFTEGERHRQVANLKEALEESNLPFRVDLFTWNELPESFRRNIENEHIDLAANDSG